MHQLAKNSRCAQNDIAIVPCYPPFDYATLTGTAWPTAAYGGDDPGTKFAAPITFFEELKRFGGLFRRATLTQIQWQVGAPRIWSSYQYNQFKITGNTSATATVDMMTLKNDTKRFEIWAQQLHEHARINMYQGQNQENMQVPLIQQRGMEDLPVLCEPDRAEEDINASGQTTTVRGTRPFSDMLTRPGMKRFFGFRTNQVNWRPFRLDKAYRTFDMERIRRRGAAAAYDVEGNNEGEDDARCGGMWFAIPQELVATFQREDTYNGQELKAEEAPNAIILNMSVAATFRFTGRY